MDATTRGIQGSMARLVRRLSPGLLVVLLVILPTWLGSSLQAPDLDPNSFDWRDTRAYASYLVWLAAMLVLWPGRWLDRGRGRWQWGPLYLLAPLAALPALAGAGLPSALDPWVSGWLAFHVLLLLGFYLTVVNSPISPGIIAWPLAIGATVEAAVALPQLALGRSLGLEALGEYPLDAYWVGASVVTLGEQRLLRAYGLTAHPNLLSGYLTLSILVGGGYYLSRRGWQQIPLLAVLGLEMAALLATFSRSAWLGAGVGGLVAFSFLGIGGPEKPFRRGSVRSLAVLALLVATLFSVANWQWLGPRLGLERQETEARSVDERILLNEAAIAVIHQRPIFGVGLGNFSAAVPGLAPASPLGPPVSTVHNLPLLAAAELGLPGGVLWLYLTVAPWVALWKARRRLRPTPWFAGVSGVLAAFTILGMLDYYLWISTSGSLLLVLVWGLWAREWCRGLKPEPRTALGTPPRTSPG